MALERKHWLMITGAALVVALLAMAPRTPSSAGGEGHGAGGRVSEDPNSGSTPHAHGPEGHDHDHDHAPASKDPQVAAIINELNAGAPPMQTILKLRDLADANPTNAEAQYHLGVFSWNTGQFDKAMDRFRNTIALDPEGYPEAYAFLGRAYATLDSLPQAIKALEKYQSLVKDSTTIQEVEVFLTDIKKKHNQ